MAGVHSQKKLVNPKMPKKRFEVNFFLPHLKSLLGLWAQKPILQGKLQKTTEQKITSTQSPSCKANWGWNWISPAAQPTFGHSIHQKNKIQNLTNQKINSTQSPSCKANRGRNPTSPAPHPSYGHSTHHKTKQINLTKKTQSPSYKVNWARTWMPTATHPNFGHSPHAVPQCSWPFQWPWPCRNCIIVLGGGGQAGCSDVWCTPCYLCRLGGGVGWQRQGREGCWVEGRSRGWGSTYM